jgi:myosin heavy subunit
MALSNNKTTLDTLKRQADKDIRNAEEIKRQADQNIRNAEEIKRRVDEIIHKAEEKKKIEEENKKLEEEKKKIEEENKKIEEEKKKIEEENNKIKEENKKLEEEIKKQADEIKHKDAKNKKLKEKNKKLKEKKKIVEEKTKQKAQPTTKTQELLPVLDKDGNLPKNDRHFSKRKTDFDPYKISIEEELERELPDHLPAVKGTRNGDIRRCYKYYMGDNFDYNNECVFPTLEEAFAHYEKHFKVENFHRKEKDKVKYAGICKMKRGYILKPEHKKGCLKWSKAKEERDNGYKIFVTWNLCMI